MRMQLFGLMTAVTTAGLIVSNPVAAQAVGYITTSGGAIFYPGSSSPGGSYTLTSTGTGRYQAVFYGMGNGLNSNVQVNAVQYGTSPDFCMSGGWGSFNGTDVTVDINCFDTSGNPANTDLVVLYQTRTQAPSQGSIAFLWADQPSATSPYVASPDYSYNSTYGLNTVTHNSNGTYTVFLPGIIDGGGNVQVSAYGSTAAHCQVSNWTPGVAGTSVTVICVNAAGFYADEYFDLSFVAGAAPGVDTSTYFGGYLWANNPYATKTYVPSKAYQYNNISTKNVTISNSGTAEFVNFSDATPSPPLWDELGMVTAYGRNGEICVPDGLGYYGSGRKQELVLTVECFSAQGVPIKAAFTAALIAGPF